MAYTIPQQKKKEVSERLGGERDQIKFIHLGFERWQVVRFRKARGRQDVPLVEPLVVLTRLRGTGIISLIS